jgi:hypothetical protein
MLQSAKLLERGTLSDGSFVYKIVLRRWEG